MALCVKNEQIIELSQKRGFNGYIEVIGQFDCVRTRALRGAGYHLRVGAGRNNNVASR